VPNGHYHLLITTPNANLSRAMHQLNAGYSNWYKSKHKIIGSVFQGRFKAILVEAVDYMMVLSAYIHLNPV
jgi:REP-associated tyrosine transposase